MTATLTRIGMGTRRESIKVSSLTERHFDTSDSKHGFYYGNTERERQRIRGEAITETYGVWSVVFTDEDGMTWSLLQRQDESMSLYGTNPELCELGHYVVYDTLDGGLPAGQANVVLDRLADIRDELLKCLREAK